MENDILIEDDLNIVDGDIAIGDCQSQNIKFLLITIPGSIYLNPKIGANIYSMQNQNNTDNRIVLNKIKSALENDKYINISVINTESGLLIEAEK